MTSVAFFPWWGLRAPMTIGAVRLIPYHRGRAPGDNGSATQVDLDGVLKAYALRKDRPIDRATLLEVGEWQTGQETNDQTREKLFRAREYLAFAGLANRQLFRGRHYCGFDNFAFYVQNYTAGDTQHFSFTTRRRDGSSNYLWGADEFSFLKPLHVDENVRPEVDQAFIQALLQADAADQAPFSAIVEFNRAQTDSQDVPLHTEVVMTKSALEYLLEVGHDCNEMITALLPLIPPRPTHRPLEGPLSQIWPSTTKRGATIRPIEAWARELCIRRNESAHGANRGANPKLVWSEHAHLAFASVLFPLLVKQQLQQRGFYQMQELDTIQLEVIESYLMCDPFAYVPNRHEQPEHAWSKIYTDLVVGEKLRRGIQREFEAIDWANIPPQ